MRLVIAGLVMLGTGFAAKDDWPQFRGPNGSGVAAAKGLPVEIGPQKNVVWKTALPAGHSSPAVAGKRIFVTGSEGDELLTLALDRDTGRVVWKRAVTRTRLTKMRMKNTPASPSPVTDGSRVFAFFDDFGMLAYDAGGKELWRLPLPPFNNPYGMAASPILAGGNVILLCDQDTGSYLLAVDSKDGRQRWRTDRAEFTHGYATPVVYRDQIIVSGSYQTVAYQASTGEKLWWVDGMAWEAKSTPVIAGDHLFVHSWMASPAELGFKTAAPPYPEALVAHDANKDGRITREEAPDEEMKKAWFLLDLDHDGAMNEREWNYHRARSTARNGLYAIRLGGRGDLTGNARWRLEKQLPNIPSPVLYEDVLYVLKEGGIVTALDPATGAVLKQGRLEGALDPYFASPVAADGKVYMVSMNGKVAVLKAGRDWQLLGVSDLGEECWATPAIAGERLYIRTATALYSFGNKRS
ncbi:MAG: PQQ-binding-like beta-propeller repeat protein [Bryobacteraceae bacterium]